MEGASKVGGSQEGSRLTALPLPWPARGLEFLMILGTESYTNFPMVPKGMSYNSFNNILFIWGNFLLQR